MTDLTNFIRDADETVLEWSGLLRVPHPDAAHAQRALFVCVDQDFEHKGPVLMAMASAGNDAGHVAISIHAFVDGERVEPTFMTIGDEIVVTIPNA